MSPPVLVSAGAGSGKTYRIVEAVVERVRAGTPVDRIAAVTFTEAAAAELQDRVRARLLALGLDREAARVDAADICTIHRFALALLRRYPLAAGLPPDPLVLDEAQSGPMFRAILAEELRDDPPARRDGGAPLRELLERSLGPGVGLSARGRGDGDTPTGRLQSVVASVLEKARSLGMRPPDVAGEGGRAADRLAAALGPDGAPGALEAALAEALAAARAFVAKRPEPPTKKDAGLYAALRELGEDARAAPLDVALRLLRADEYSAKLKDVAEPLVASARRVATEHPEVRRRLLDGVRGVFAAAARVLERYTAEKARMGAVDFEDMQLLALDLLVGTHGAPGYAPLVAAALPLVVVDEFQDTSPLQFRLFEVLREAGAEVRYVGDLKQGIYGFRTADSALFAALLERAEETGSPRETLDRCRRSRPELVAFANALFGALMPRHGLAYAPLVAENDYARGACPKAVPSVEVAHHPRPHVHGPKLAAGVARVLALTGEGGIDVLDRATGAARRARLGDVAVLARDNDSLARWSEALHARGVATVLEREGLFETLEVRLALAWLRMLASARDRAAAAAVLLSELYGVSQRTMVRLVLEKAAGSPRRALEVHRASPERLPLAPFELRALERCRDDLEACRQVLRQLPLPEAVESVLERVELATRLALRCDPAEAAQVRANLAALVAIAHRLAARGERALSLAGATGVTLENLLVEVDREARAGARQPVAAEDAPDAVRLVTIHRSKGMEYPVVVLDALAKKLDVRLPRVEVVRPADRDVLLGPGALAASGVQLVPDVGVDPLRDALAGLFQGAEQLRQEWLRLLYVAVTRARDHLVILWPEESKGAGTEYVRGLLTAHVRPPPSAPGDATWEGLGVAVRVTTAPPDDGAEEAAREAPSLDAWRALAEGGGDAVAPAGEGAAARLARVSPSELCQVADCPEVPRLARFAREEHHLARSAGAALDARPIPRAWEERAAVPRDVAPSRVGRVVHAAVERARLLGPSAGDADLAARVLALAGEAAHGAPLAALVVRTLASLRAAVAALGATAEPAREVPFAIDLAGTTLHGVVDLVVRSAAGLHVVDLKTHLLAPDDLPKWLGYYRPQVDAYALAVGRLTGEPVAGRHLAVPAAGLLVTVPGAFDPGAAEASLGALADALAREARGPAQDCAACGWLRQCRVGRAAVTAA